MNRAELDNRLRELGIYSDFYYRKELMSLHQLLSEGEKLNCIFTGVNEANRKMVAITDSRIIIIFAGALGSGEVKVVKKSAVKSCSFEKKFLFSTASFSTSNEDFFFKNVEGKVKGLFESAMA